MLTLFMAISGGIDWDDGLRPLRTVSPVAVGALVLYIIITAPWQAELIHCQTRFTSHGPWIFCHYNTLARGEDVMDAFLGHFDNLRKVFYCEKNT